ncbi:MAG: type II toxin-antitoxin system VapC family toxin, partial [Planctomycetes bacterium]|nr:type II toxin-antitoxin system VapC family toxin [Planctomycetota bacterium]
PSYLVARSSRDLVVAAHQQITQEWWDGRSKFELFVSQLVLREANSGDSEVAAKRMEALQDIPILELTEEANALASELITQGALPENATVDALHIAIAVVNGMDYLLTWNCAHIANATMRGTIEYVCRTKGYEPPVICTPEELMED